jgi:hypothetical protein
MALEYLGLAGTIIAVINALLALIIAVLPRGSQLTKMRIGAIAVALGLFAVVAALYPQDDAQGAQAQQQRSERREIRRQLDGFVRDGTALLAKIKDSKQALPNKQADLWAQQAEIYLRDRLGERYVARYRADLGDLYGDTNVAHERLGYWRAVRTRVINLEKVSAEFPP